MSDAKDLLKSFDEAQARAGAKLYIYFAGGREYEFILAEWERPRDVTGLPTPEYRMWEMKKLDGSEEINIIFFNVALVRYEF